MRITHDFDGADWQAVSDLFVRVGWNRREPEHIRAACAKSSHLIFIHIDGRLAGFGRTMDDGRYYAMLVDVVVEPDFQGRGLGRTITDYLRAQLDGYSFVTLTAAPGKQDFYAKLGWAKQQSAMIWPRSEQQPDTNT